MNLKNTIEKITNWEHWPSFMFYLPNLPYAFYLAIKAKHPVFFSAANPSIKDSGNGTESKYQTLALIPDNYKPTSIFIRANTSFNEVTKLIKQHKISYPLIAKPDIGFRGLLVKKIKNKEELQTYISKYNINLIIQDFIDYDNECGIFYHRIPGATQGTISSITLKEFSTVTGNGKDSIKKLIEQDKRTALYLPLFEEIHKENLNNILEKGKTIQLSNIGNHCKGTAFKNGNHLISKKLQDTFDNLSKNIDGWYYGRLDIKYNSFKELEKGKNFKILEINGIIAEPTHIYDTKNNSYVSSLKTIRLHWKYLFEVAITNHKKNNTPYKKPLPFIKDLITLNKYKKLITKL